MENAKDAPLAEAEDPWPPPTTAELDEWESLSRAPDDDDYEERYARDYPEMSSEAIERLVAEVRRLQLCLAAHHVRMGLAFPHPSEGPCPICAEAASPPAPQALIDD